MFSTTVEPTVAHPASSASNRRNAFFIGTRDIWSNDAVDELSTWPDFPVDKAEEQGAKPKREAEARKSRRAE